MIKTMLRWLSTLLAACLLMGLPVALMEEANAPLEAPVEESNPTLGGNPADGVEAEVGEAIGAELAGAVEVEDLKLNHRGLVTLNVGDTLQLSYTLMPKGAKADIQWIAQCDSKDWKLSKCISISDDGLVTALKAGTCFAIVRASTPERSIIDAVNIKVVDSGMDQVGGIAIDKAHFPDKIFRKFVQFQYDRDNDNALSNDEITDAFFMELNGNHTPELRDIASLEGIQYLKNMKEVYLYHHLDKLTSLNLSKVAKLEILHCVHLDKLKSIATTGNKALKQLFINELPALSSLDISKSTKLDEVVVQGAKKLTKLNVAKNTLLTRLELFETGLTALNVANNTKLVELVCQESALTKLDVSKNKKLKILNCGGNRLTKLDVSKNTALEWLDAGGNALKTLKLGKNSNLKYVVCCGNGKNLTTVDISGCKTLVDLVCATRPTRTGGYGHIQFTKNNNKIALVIDKDVIPKLVGKDVPGVAVFTKAGSYTAKVGERFWIELDGVALKSCKSSNTKVATVKNGLVTTLKAGTAKLTVTPKKGKKFTIALTVKAK